MGLPPSEPVDNYGEPVDPYGAQPVDSYEETRVRREVDPVDPAPVEEVDRVERRGRGVDAEYDERVVRRNPDAVRSERVTADFAAERRLRLSKASQLIWLALGIVEIFIALRVVLKLLAANEGSAFARFIYGVGGAFASPFSGLVNNPNYSGHILEVTSLIAMAIWALVAWVIVRALWALFAPTESRSESYHDSRRV